MDPSTISQDLFKITDLSYKKNIVLLGDSTLDNIAWVSSYEECIAKLVRDRGIKVINYSADGFKTKDMLEGCMPCISMGARHTVGDSFPSGEGEFKPLDHTDALENAEHSIFVVSVGGNDIREELRNIYMGTADVPAVMQRAVKNYTQMLERLLKKNKKVVLCTQYKPSLKDNTYQIYEILGKEQVVQIMKLFYPPLFELARAYNLPILDFTRSLDPNDGSLFKAQIEPSKIGSVRIADMISHVAESHDFDGPSRVYVKRTNNSPVISEENTKTFHWDIESWEWPKSLDIEQAPKENIPMFQGPRLE